MASKAPLAICAALLSAGISGNAAAQDAAETAIILSGTGQSQGAASRSLGANISQSINAAANAVRSSRGGEYGTPRRRSGYVVQAEGIPANVDVLEGTNAPTYKLGNGASIRVSGRLIQTPETSCVKNCAERAVP